MNTHQLMCAIHCDADMKKKVIGVFASDQIPKYYHRRPFGLIVNSDPHYLGGRHWLAFYVDERGVLEAFDSYGNFPDMYSPFLKDFMRRFTRKSVNTKILQSVDTKVCGQYCLFYLMCRCRGYSMTDFTNMFSREYEINDQFVYNFVNTRFCCCMFPLDGFCQSCTNKL